MPLPKHQPLMVGEPKALPCRSSWRFVGDPIDVVTGANTEITLDFRLPGELPLRWRSCYNSSRNTVAGVLGWGHTHAYDRTLTLDLDGLRYTDPFGSEVEFPALEVGCYAASAGFILCRLTGNTYELSQPGEPVQEFQFNGVGYSTPLCCLRRGQATIAL